MSLKIRFRFDGKSFNSTRSILARPTPLPCWKELGRTGLDDFWRVQASHVSALLMAPLTSCLAPS